MEPSVVRLRATSGAPLTDLNVRGMVVAAAQSLAERSGIQLVAVTADERSVTLSIRVDKLAAMGFLAELRRNTNAWFERKYNKGPLWVEGDLDA